MPPAAPATVRRLANDSERYAFADRAYAMNYGFGRAPPDYAFAYGGDERPWVWRGDDQSMMVAERLPDGEYRDYYYEPGSVTPYLIRCQDYSYGYDNGALVVVYDRDGHAYYPDQGRADVGGRLLARAIDIAEASTRERREAVAESNWTARRERFEAGRAAWSQGQAADPGWRDYHAAHAAQDDSFWAAERYRREAEAARYAQSMSDQAAAQRDWRAARQAQATAAVHAPGAPQNHGFFAGFRPKPPAVAPAPTAPPRPPAQAAAAQLPPQVQREIAAYAAKREAVAQAQAAQAKTQAQARTQAQAHTHAQALAETQGAARAQAQAQAQAQALALSGARARQAEALAAQQAQARAAALRNVAQNQAQARAQAQAQAQAQRQQGLAAAEAQARA
ncbi:MAG: hypothetical protein ACREEQ_03735, partial [Caulobacteraceae bacterium]